MPRRRPSAIRNVDSIEPTMNATTTRKRNAAAARFPRAKSPENVETLPVMLAEKKPTA
jgi:hypothetical protein